jgi:hypothetical protein
MWRDALTLQSRQLMRSLVLAFHSARQLNLEPVARAYNHDCRIGSASHMGSFITVRLDAEATQEVVRLALSWFEDEVILGPMALLHVPMP